VERTKVEVLSDVGMVLSACTTEEEVVVVGSTKEVLEGTKEETSVLYQMLARVSSSYI
jgi:hypothetical protein